MIDDFDGELKEFKCPACDWKYPRSWRCPFCGCCDTCCDNRQAQGTHPDINAMVEAERLEKMKEEA